MRKQNSLVSIFLIVTCISSTLAIQLANADVSRIQSNSINRQIYSKIDSILKKVEEEENEKKRLLEKNITRLLTQFNINESEEYWLFGIEWKAKKSLSLDIYVDDVENIEHFVVVPLDKLSFFNENGDELCFFKIMDYTVADGNIEGLWETTGRDLLDREEIQTALKDLEKVIERKLNYVETIESYEWPQAKQPKYKLEDLQNTEIYQNFDAYIEKGFYFPTGSEVYLGLWNGYSNRVRMMYRTLGSDEKIHYYSTEMSLNGQRCNFINETMEKIYERFKLISVKMM